MHRFWSMVITAVFLTGCSTPAPQAQPQARPAPGDTVFPIVRCPKSWTAGAAVVLSVQLGCKNAGESKPVILSYESVPEAPELRATFTFFKGEQEVKRYADVLLVPGC